MKYQGLPRRPGRRRTATAVSVLLLPLTLSSLAGCSDDGSTAAPPVASPAATASGARCVTDPPASEEGADATPAATGAYARESGDKAAPRKKSFRAKKRDVSAVLVSGSGQVSTRDSKISKRGSTTSVDASGNHGLNAAALARDGGRLALSGGKLITKGKGATAVFASGKDARATLSGNIIKTTGGSARGVSASYGGEVGLTYVEVDTAGAQAAPVAVGPGGGKVTVSGGTMTSAGCGSPGVQTAGDVSVKGTLFDLANSEAFTVESGGSLSLKDVRATAAAGGVVLRGEDTASFSMTGGSVQAADGDLFSVRQAVADIEVRGGAELKTKGGALLRVRDKGIATFTADNEKLKGDVLVSNGSATLDLTGSTRLDGAVAGASLTLDGRAKWSVAKDSWVKGLELNSGASVADSIDGNGYSVTYDRSSSPGLGGRTYRLNGGGTLRPA
ncbi:hypothetical protein OKJ48_13800 [Streptomyces kunmingensis]|uniref:Lipoprotein n=1 Tax=Streptomyces kunmingensis TaxID=68225 RepID=A0ABU6C9C1_9ACTN|nr:hypothetical protein [Streptomyces kunmingensis]MEB3961312.1 hypothetical protein [Streptomyces kunmingensis]